MTGSRAVTWETSGSKWALEPKRLPGNRREFKSPCAVPVVVHGLGVEATLALMHHHRMFDSVRVALTKDSFAKADVRCQADFLAWYGRLDMLAELLEKSEMACEYVLRYLNPANVAAMAFDDDRYLPSGDVANAIEMARVCAAARAAREALASLDE